MPTIARFVALLAVLGLWGCTRVICKKDPGPCDRGFRFNRPKPYLFIGPAEAEAKKSDSGTKKTPSKTDGNNEDDSDLDEQQDVEVKGDIKVSGKVEVKPNKPTPSEVKPPDATNLFTRVVIEIKYLPDYNELYSVKLQPGIGKGKLEFKLEDGWNLTSVGIETDQQLAQLISSIASLVGAVKPGGKAGGGASPSTKATKENNRAYSEMEFLVDTRRDVPLGFYEPVIVTDEHGCKSLFGWRYVGFMPFAGCPVTPCIHSQPVDCDPSQIWGLIVADGSLKFDTLDHVSRGVTHIKRKGGMNDLEWGPALEEYKATENGQQVTKYRPVLGPATHDSANHP